MRKLFPFVLFFIFLASTSVAQQNNRPIGENIHQYEAGQYLKDFSKQYFTGFALLTGGYIIIIKAASNMSTSNDVDPGLFVGTLMTLGGSIMMLASHAKIGKAGEHLMMSSQQIGYNGARLNSVGWSFRLGNKQHKHLLARN